MTLARALKLHLRRFEIHGRALRIVTLRPQTEVRFSTNYFHDTWHILAGSDGVALLGRLLWGLAFQRHPGTALLIDDPHLVTTPFDGDPPDPILLIPEGLTSLDDDALRALRLRLRRASGVPTTIRWHTFGMQRALAAESPRWHAERSLARERMSRRAGFVCYTARPAALRDHAIDVYRMRDGYANYHPVAARGRWGGCTSDGEIQLIPDFTECVSAARVARRELLDDARTIATDVERWAIETRTRLVLRRQRAARQPRER
jgi:hypothetical protein